MFNPAISIDKLNQMSGQTMVEQVGIEFTEITTDSLSAKMPVDHRTVQPMRILHGGASLVLAETLGSIASASLVDLEKFAPVGLEINANHLKSVGEGNWVYGTVKAIHIGRKTHVWNIEIKNEAGQLVCISRLTVAIIDKSASSK